MDLLEALDLFCKASLFLNLSSYSDLDLPIGLQQDSLAKSV
jgi:hypothetical protein